MLDQKYINIIDYKYPLLALDGKSSLQFLDMLSGDHVRIFHIISKYVSSVVKTDLKNYFKSHQFSKSKGYSETLCNWLKSNVFCIN